MNRVGNLVGRIVGRRELPPVLSTTILGDCPGGVEDQKDQTRNDHEAPVEGDEVVLVQHEIARPPLSQLDRAEDAADVDGEVGHEQGDEKLDIITRQADLGCAARKVDGEAREDGHGDQLEDHSDDHDVGAHFGVLSGLGGH